MTETAWRYPCCNQTHFGGRQHHCPENICEENTDHYVKHFHSDFYSSGNQNTFFLSPRWYRGSRWVRWHPTDPVTQIQHLGRRLLSAPDPHAAEDIRELTASHNQDAWSPLRAQSTPRMPNQPFSRSLEHTSESFTRPCKWHSTTSPDHASCSKPDH